MKKLLTIAFLIIGMIVNAQNIRFVDKEYFTASIAIDPGATIKDGLNITPQLELVSYWKYIKVNTQIMPSLQGGYVDFTGAVGVNLTSGYFDKYRAYTGIRMGHIRRGKYGYPLAGIEAGIDFNVTNNTFIGIRSTGDYRTDFKYSGANPEVIYSGYILLGTKF